MLSIDATKQASKVCALCPMDGRLRATDENEGRRQSMQTVCTCLHVLCSLTEENEYVPPFYDHLRVAPPANASMEVSDVREE